MSKKHILQATMAGVVSGIFLGLFFKFAQTVTEIKVYTLLLNVDYVPILQSFRRSETFEFSLHLIISILLSIVILYIIQSKGWGNREKITFTIFVSVAVGIILYPTTLLSERTPAFTDMYAFLLWLVGHLIYGVLLGSMIREKW
ncbi:MULTISPECIES: hypothetical protein [unclassified Bacillus (in: firmicutes)]|uniref:hypothetical protein n=1 Tax=unclassified Bacillus (in: firmicutes) TaxID=185979 RepID=UPI000B8A126F|nr:MULTISPECIES: hypothetical protein [unclassified Bacillus (in: firmicutes)]